VAGCLCVCRSICYHNNLKLRALILTKLGLLYVKVVTIYSWLNFGCPAPPGKGSVAGRKFSAQPYYSQRAVFASLEHFFISLCIWCLNMESKPVMKLNQLAEHCLANTCLHNFCIVLSMQFPVTRGQASSCQSRAVRNIHFVLLQAATLQGSNPDQVIHTHMPSASWSHDCMLP